MHYISESFWLTDLHIKYKAAEHSPLFILILFILCEGLEVCVNLCFSKATPAIHKESTTINDWFHWGLNPGPSAKALHDDHYTMEPVLNGAFPLYSSSTTRLGLVPGTFSITIAP